MGKGVIDAGASSGFSLHLAEGARREEPLVKSVAGMSEGRFETLAFPAAEAVERNREVVDPND
jgi:hypothetical protein